MKYSTELDKKTDILKVVVTGKYKRPQDAKVLQQYMLEFCEENHCRRILVDLKNAILVGTTMDIFTASTMPGDPNHNLIACKIALLYERITEDQKFVENVAFNRGYFNVHIFDDYEQAIEWLIPTEEQTNRNLYKNKSKKL